ncbi:hypothetical protein H4683_002751 [Filibacter limicola]|uniref:Uncharacterized protein n=1 Tax=Sporosarcina limicola TaxID=34101 RepID=A0A927R400_9BACL|nr:hypothetical protein [Sporosarcina limicola]
MEFPRVVRVTTFETLRVTFTITLLVVAMLALNTNHKK